MSKTSFNGIHIDLSDVSLIGKLERAQGAWYAPIVWRNTGASIKLKMADEGEQYTIIIGDRQIEEEKQAKENYDRLVGEWKASS